MLSWSYSNKHISLICEFTVQDKMYQYTSTEVQKNVLQYKWKMDKKLVPKYKPPSIIK